jgi:hypothetical protein
VLHACSRLLKQFTFDDARALLEQHIKVDTRFLWSSLP